MRNNSYDIVFDGPHFISWRMVHGGHVPLVKVPGNLQFLLLAHKDATEIKTLNDLVGKKICGYPPPNPATLTIYAEFDNPVRQPNFIGIDGEMKEIYNHFLAGDCDAAVFRDSFDNNNLTPEERDKFKVLFTSAAIPNQGISINGDKVGAELRARMVAALTTSEEGKRASRPLLDRFAKTADSLLPATVAEYSGHNRYLEGVIYGW